ncbi:hypothetical protein EDB19DRAFT_483783 [Suillus lakei]|nr:hypothetical protein EDB19DRAFT_483783 [Suillus lakei]
MNTTRPIPKGRVQTLIGGMALVGAGFGALWMWMQKHQAQKEQKGALPTWETRIYQAQHPADNTSNPATLRQASPQPGVHSASAQPGFTASTKTSPERADQAVPHAPQTKSGSSTDPSVGPAPGEEPTPQRTDESSGRVYTKAPAYVDSFNAKK